MELIDPIRPKSEQLQQDPSTYQLLLPIPQSLSKKLQAFENWQDLALDAIAIWLAALETSIITDQFENGLKSEKSLDYSQLSHLLAAGSWKEADLETAEKMLLAMGKNNWFNVYPSDIDKFPCNDLMIIDRLWLKYSKGRFGFSVQKKIWQTIQDKNSYEIFKKLGERVGWCKGGELIEYNALTFALDGSVGHLPVRSNVLRWVWHGVLLERLFYRLDVCHCDGKI